MESQDGISVRPMRLKVLYTFDDESKTHCLARWPQLLDIQTAYLDEKTQIGVIELKTCIQAIVSASPELVAKLGHDYTVYAYDYSEYETPLVGQGMLSWVLASASPTPNAPAHQSQTMVTGRVCKNVLGLFTKGAQETLEVKLRLVPVPTVLQSEYLESMQKYRELSNVIPHEFDAQVWTNFLRQNPNLLSYTKSQQPERTTSPISHSGIEKFHQLLCEGSTPRELPSIHPNDQYRSASPSQSIIVPPSRVSTPGGQHSSSRQQQQQQQSGGAPSDLIRPESSASMRDADFQSRPSLARRDSMQSGYGSGEDSAEPPRKRAKLYRADWPGKSDYNIERQPSSLRVAASTAASVRIHRPTPMNPSIAAAQQSGDEPVRPPTPISRPTDLSRRVRSTPSLLREASSQSLVQYTSPYPMSDDQPPEDPATTSPEEVRYQGLFEPSFSMPSSPPVMDCGFPPRSSPVLPPMVMDQDSGFMSGGLEDLLDNEADTPGDECQGAVSNKPANSQGTARQTTVSQANSPDETRSALGNSSRPLQLNTGFAGLTPKEMSPTLPRPPLSRTNSRPSSRAGVRPTPKPLAPAPMSQSEVEQLMSSLPASDPVIPGQLQHSHSWAGPMSDYPTVATPAPQPMEEVKVRSGAGARRLRQVQARLDQCIKNGKAPPFCENCGAIETPTWRRAWSKEIVGSEQHAIEFVKDPTILFWQALERDDNDNVTKFKLYKKSLVDEDNDFVQVLLCNPCGLWLHKFKTMRPENKWNKHPKDKRKRPSRNRKGGPLSNGNASTRSRSKTQTHKPAESSPGPSDASSPPGEDGITPRVDNENDNDDDIQESLSKRRRANSMEPRRSTDTVQSHWEEHDAMEALRRAIQSSPARNMDKRPVPTAGEDLTPQPVRRALFPHSQSDGPLKPLEESMTNSPRRSPRSGFQQKADKSARDKENLGSFDDLFESPSFQFDTLSSPTPKRRARPSFLEKRLSLPGVSPTKRKNGKLDMSPARLAAERLQNANKQSRNDLSGLAALQSEVIGPENLEAIDNIIMDMLDDNAASVTMQRDGLYPQAVNDWTDWLPSNYVSPAGSDDENIPAGGNSIAQEDTDDLINAILSDPDVHKENLHNSQFNPFISVLDSGFFSSDSLNNQDLTEIGPKDDKSTYHPGGKKQPADSQDLSPSKEGLAVIIGP
ncbi:hypothetical protein ASPZODRAFT_57492 [Penicilliopsis zonata CBS 506.65]|uniref:Ams2/SPT21 N-terminal domain-containing protein n=1 Tax=Penicilliopsis zonata CBS 506.65 TaxID=1073090 RepID=A0A1L9SV70_9EURO|nr:hypothetical protein ASPZODRAFT_57492 [Penicilliopsis zonata CBS 506.65]OJJ51014.1 hypothetical protein ASPZODRAFT_57492 [Penicilliopsis zonata CBS 506.65]